MNVGKAVASTMRLPKVMLSVMLIDVPTQAVRRLSGTPTRRVTYVPPPPPEERVDRRDPLSDTSKGTSSMKQRRKRV